MMISKVTMLIAILVANKVDMPARQVGTSQGTKFAQENGLLYIVGIFNRKPVANLDSMSRNYSRLWLNRYS